MLRNKISDDKLRHALAGLSFFGLLIYWWQADYFGYELLSEIAIFAILAMSLDFIAGFGGLVSLGQAALFGAGAYIYAYASINLALPISASMIISVLSVSVISFLTACVIIRLHGLFFIVMTLVLGAMGYEFVFKNRVLGGDDGLSGIPRMDLNAIGINTADPQVFSFLLLTMAALVYLFLWRLLRSPFGDVLQALHDNESRMRALGVSAWNYRVAAFTVAGFLSGLAGVLSAQHIMFISPQLLHWTHSGEILVMIILGGIETLVGGIIGAIFLVFLRHEMSAYTDYWGFFLGAFLIFVILLGGRGLVGWIDYLWNRYAAKK